MGTEGEMDARIKAELAGMNAEFAQYDGIELDMEKPEELTERSLP